MLLEICAGSVQSALAAERGGAHRIELCSHLMAGGLTPSAAAVLFAMEQITIPLHVLIRPRVGHFVYSTLEIEQMRRDIAFCQSHGVAGVVFGALRADGQLDEVANRQLIEAAGPMQLTFHRAFDDLDQPHKALESLIRWGFHRVLTSGQAPTALEGLSLIKNLVKSAEERIIILPGSGLNSKNVREFVKHTQAKEIHASAKKVLSEPYSNLFQADYYETDAAEVRRLVEVLSTFQASQ